MTINQLCNFINQYEPLGFRLEKAEINVQDDTYIDLKGDKEETRIERISFNFTIKK